jgi:GT2 family glycosyltransferase
MATSVVTAFRHASLVILRWNQATAQNDFSLIVKKTHSIPKPYLGLPLSADRRQVLILAQVGETLLAEKLAIKLLAPDGTRLASLGKAHLPAWANADFSEFTPEQCHRLCRGLRQGLPQTFPDLADAVINTLIAPLIRQDSTRLSPRQPSEAMTLNQTTVAKPSNALRVVPQTLPSGVAPIRLKRRVRRIGSQSERTFMLEIEHCSCLPRLGLFFGGYLAAAPGRLRRLVLHLPCGRTDLTAQLVRTPHPSLVRQCRWAGLPVEAQPGLECFFLTDQSLTVLEQGVLAAELDDGQIALVALHPVINLTASQDLLEPSQALRLLEGFGAQLHQSARQQIQRQGLIPLLHALGGWLNKRQNSLTISPGRAKEPVTVHFDTLLALGSHGLHLHGWLADTQSQLEALHLCTSFGDSVELTGRIPNMARPDVLRYLRQQGLNPMSEMVGFHQRVELPLPLGADTPVYLRVRRRDGYVQRQALRLQAINAEQPLPNIRELLGSFPTWMPQLFDFYDQKVGPTIAGLWSERQRPRIIPDSETFGVLPEQPLVSLIVPLYGRVDLLSYQLAQFADDEDFHRCELIYVLDDPGLLNEFVARCRQDAPLFGVPFKTITSGGNLGYAGATNLGASQARGEYLLLLNSDVFPRQSGWLSRLVEVFTSLEQPGALGPKLLFADGLIQHAGMAFFQEPSLPGFWFNTHPDKGLPNHPAGDSPPRQVAAVTGACMLLERSVYFKVGGLSEDYILGDFEDSDLCLKLRAAGYAIWYTPHVELYHLERLSFPYAGDLGWRTNLSRYNAWVQTRRWGTSIRQLTEHPTALSLCRPLSAA